MVVLLAEVGSSPSACTQTMAQKSSNPFIVLDKWGKTTILRAANRGHAKADMLLEDFGSSLDEVDKSSMFSKVRY